MDAGLFVSCGVRASGGQLCWGSNPPVSNAIFGDDVPHPAPVPVVTSSSFATVRAGYAFACGLEAGALECWGTNAPSGVLGNITMSKSATPRRLGPALTFTTFDVGTAGPCAIATDTRTYCWGGLRTSSAVAVR